MPTPSKFTADRRQVIVEARRLGASLRTCARQAGITHTTLERWLEKGETAPEGSRYREFWTQYEAADADASLHYLRIVHESAIDKPDLAMRWLERREDGYEPPSTRHAPAVAQPLVVHLTFHDGDPVPEFGDATVVEIGEVENSGPALPEARTDPAPS